MKKLVKMANTEPNCFGFIHLTEVIMQRQKVMSSDLEDLICSGSISNTKLSDAFNLKVSVEECRGMYAS